MGFYRGRLLQGYLAGRAGVLVALLALAATYQAAQGGAPIPFVWFSAATAGAFAFTLVSALALRREVDHPLLARLQPAWDVAYATAVVFLSGGAFSPFATLYPLAIIGGAILLLRRGALVVATASSLAYGLLVDLQFFEVVRPVNPFPLPPPGGENLVFQLLFNLVAFYALALLAGYLAEELRRTGESLALARAEVLQLAHLQEAILQNLGSGLVALDEQGREVFHNRAAEELLRRAGEELVPGMDLGGLFDLEGGRRNESAFRANQVVFGYTVSQLLDQRGEARGKILIFQDLTTVKRLEEDLRRSDRLAAVGRLAAGLAHEIRNPLASLAGSVEVLRQNLSPGAEDAQLFAIVLRETERLNRLVTNFLHYARPGKAVPAAFDLGELVDETGFFFSQGEGRTGFRLDNRVPGGLCLTGDRAQMEQLLLNLFRNSREAAPDGVDVCVEGVAEGQWVWLTVRDDGPGMAPEVAERAFEPFFSSRPGGTGLGLATVHRIVENHGGTLTLETSPGRGTAFHLRLPAA